MNSYGTMQTSDATLTEHGSLKNRVFPEPERTILDTLKADRICHSALNSDTNHMMFSFNSEKIRSCIDSQGTDENHPALSSTGHDRPEEPVKLLRKKSALQLGGTEPTQLQTVAGIKEVEEVDALVIDDDTLMKCPNCLSLSTR
jgi:hypothetical protein